MPDVGKKKNRCTRFNSIVVYLKNVLSGIRRVFRLYQNCMLFQEIEYEDEFCSMDRIFTNVFLGRR